VFGSVANNGIRLEKQYFGAIISEKTPNGPFEPPAVDGIAGFAQQFLSEVDAPTMIDTLSSQNPSCPKIFSLCGDSHVTGGIVSVCGFPSRYENTVQWTPMVEPSSPFYKIQVNGFSANGQPLNVRSSAFASTIIDSGTTLALVPSTVISAIKQSVLANCSSNYVKGVCDTSSDNTIFDNGNCKSLSPEDVLSYPELEIQAGQDSPITIVINPSSYIVPGFCQDPTQYLFAFQSSDGSGLPGMLIGDPILLSNEIVFDVENQRMGFAPKQSCQFN
jgi:hypothetical protein